MESSLIIFAVLMHLFASIQHSSTDQFAVDEQIPDISARYLPQSDPLIIEKILEGRGKLLEPGVVRQPKIDVKSELGKLNFSHSWNDEWPTKARKLGSVSAVSFDNEGKVLVFHRGDHVWNYATFDSKNVYMPRKDGPIVDNTIVAFDRKTGQVSYEWGSNLFYMPHGLTVDQENNIWITDVGLHQVMKFNWKNRTNPEMVLGTAFQPGSGPTKFCKPTAVAVLPDGDFFVSDGYCNARIIKYSRAGEMILSWGHNSFQGVAYDHAPRNFFAIPHALTLAADLGLLCVADRENGRVQCFSTSNGTFHSQYHSGIVGDRLFSVAYAPINGGQLYVVNGPQNPKSHHAIMGFVIDMKIQNVVSKFGPHGKAFDNPHDIIVSQDTGEIYVAQLAPNIVYKFSKIDANPSSSSAATNSNSSQNKNNIAKPTVLTNNPKSSQQSDSATSSDVEGSRQMLFIIGLFVSFICVTLFAVWIIARRRKLDLRNRRRHAWDFPAVKTDGFKLGNLLERKHGFEKLDQEASDEEPNASTNMLSSAQFA